MLELRNCYIAFICEGGAEQAILGLLLENNKLRFNKLDLIDDKLLRRTSAKNLNNHINE